MDEQKLNEIEARIENRDRDLMLGDTVSTEAYFDEIALEDRPATTGKITRLTGAYAWVDGERYHLSCVEQQVPSAEDDLRTLLDEVKRLQAIDERLK